LPKRMWGMHCAKNWTAPHTVFHGMQVTAQPYGRPARAIRFPNPR